MAATVDGGISRYAGPSLTLARSWRGQGRGGNAGARASALKMRGVAVLRWEVSDCDAVRSEDIVDADKGGMRLNASAITTMSSVGERGAAAMAMRGAKPARNIALTCARKLQRLTLGSAKSTVT
jgi:hypothetical protein